MLDILAPLHHLVRRHPEEEEVLRPDLLADFDVGAVERADGQRTVQRLSFMLPVPEASLPAVEICSDRSAAGISRSAMETL